MHGRASQPGSRASQPGGHNRNKTTKMKYKGKYNTGSSRLKKWNYAGKGTYFITMVTQNRRCIFGSIENGMMQDNEWGKITRREWYRSFEIRKEISMDAFVLMPNHLHAVITIIPPAVTKEKAVTSPEVRAKASPAFIRKPKSLSSFVAGYKSSVTTQINNWIDRNISPMLFPELKKYNKENRLWQPNYHDHIVRTPYEYHRILRYIENNPKKWEEDRLYDKYHLSV
ncbi:hypothetical protein ED312_22470 [Sinomicrobium pectinilyticum]|uniref:Transposase IS200-like domain-containing protein n=2 Tax=Sinomicrobium pectinilyticum TaxID=1084421 RepID=A0A3N0D1A5_SINP1|nr:hypothetical protein ED312_22470 [Sinomicrobium pectinilyticum]